MNQLTPTNLPFPGGTAVTPGIVNPNLQDLFFIYDFNFGNVTTGATVPSSQQLQADANFEWEATTFFATLNGATEPVSDNCQFPFTIQLTNSGTGRAFFASQSSTNVPSQAVPVGNISGTGKFPFVLPQPYLFAANSSIQVVLTSLSANTWNNCHLSMIGKKTFLTYPLLGVAIS